MVRSGLVAILAALFFCLLPAQVQARSQTLNINIDDRTTAQPAAGVKIDIQDMQGHSLGSGVTGPNGNASITIELPDGVDKVLISTDAGSAGGRPGFWVLD